MKGLRPFFGYFGSKWRLAPTYPAPVFDRLIEPFAGSAGYACRHHTQSVVLCESNPVIADIWAYLIGASTSRILALPDVPEEGISALTGVSFAERALMGMWCSKAPSAPRNTMVPWAAKYPGSSWWGPRIRDRLARQVPAIRHWSVVQGSFEDLHPERATWFVDPPYQVRGSTYTCGSKSIDYAALGAWCRTRPGQVIVCENEGATWLPFEAHTCIRGVSRRSTEAVWTNY